MLNITKDTMSFKFLSRWDTKIKKFNSDSDYYKSYFPKTFCQYYRMVIFNILKVLAAGVMLFALIPNAIYIITIGPGTLVGYSTALSLFYFLGFLGLFFGGGLLILYCLFMTIGHTCEYVSGVYRKYKKDVPKVDKEPSFIKTAYKSYKNKFCPIVNFVNNKQEVETNEH